MKSSFLPSVRVAPELRAELEAVLLEGESLSSFVESDVRAAAHRRRTQDEFIARGLAARDEARRTGVYFTLDQVDATLSGMLNKARQSRRARMKTVAIVVTGAGSLLALAAANALDALLPPGAEMEVVVPDMVRYELVRDLRVPGARKAAGWVKANEGKALRVAATETFAAFQVLLAAKPDTTAVGRSEGAASEVLSEQRERRRTVILLFNDGDVGMRNFLRPLPAGVLETTTSEVLAGVVATGQLLEGASRPMSESNQARFANYGNNPLEIAARTASTGLELSMSAEQLRDIFNSGRVPANLESHVRSLLDGKASALLLEAVATQMSTETGIERARVWLRMLGIAQDLGSTRDIWQLRHRVGDRTW